MFIEFKKVTSSCSIVCHLLRVISICESINTMNIFVHMYDIITQPTICQNRELHETKSGLIVNASNATNRYLHGIWPPS